MASFDPLLLRFIERLAVVLLGGMAIYLGYRLFQLVPESKDSSGRVVLPWNVSIVMTRVGPGVFFALFGVAAVGLALLRPLQIDGTDASRSGESRRVSYAGEGGPEDPGNRIDDRRLLKKEINILNAIPQRLRAELPAPDREEVEAAIPRIKLLLMKPVWGKPEQGFGDFARFETWVRDGGHDPAPPGMAGALELYRYYTGG